MYERVRPGQAGRLRGADRARRGGAGRRRAPGAARARSAFLPLMFLLAIAMPLREGVTVTTGMAVTMFGVFWIGMAIAHAVLLRGLAARRWDRHRRPARHVRRRHRRVPRRPLVRHAASWRRGSRRTRRVEGLAFGVVVATLARLVRRALPGLALGRPRRCCSASRSALAAPLGDLFESQIKRDSGVKDTGHAVRRPRRRAGPPRRRASSRSSPATTSGSRCCERSAARISRACGAGCARLPVGAGGAGRSASGPTCCPTAART